VAFIYTALGVFFTCLNARENRDVYFSMSLPVRKSDVVLARFGMVSVMQLIQIALAVPIAILRNRILPPNPAGIEANVAFFGFVFVMFAIFNGIFLPLFFKTAYKIGLPLIWASVAMTFFIVGMEVLVNVQPWCKANLDSSAMDRQIAQIPWLIGGMAIYALVMFLAFQKAKRNFDRLDL
jgi:hypothetical protein